MKYMVVYDSQYGNTKTIAEAIANKLAEKGSGITINVQDVQAGDLAELSLLVVGSPTQQLSATSAIKGWLDDLPPDSLKGIRAAAFDTRFTQEKIDEIKLLSFFVSIFGYGAKPIANRLSRKGAQLIAEPEGFYVGDTEGPLLEDELERAASWADSLLP
ncbi:MAG: flavodoxin family protein [Anaerolineales bacterium]